MLQSTFTLELDSRWVQFMLSMSIHKLLLLTKHSLLVPQLLKLSYTLLAQLELHRPSLLSKFRILIPLLPQLNKKHRQSQFCKIAKHQLTVATWIGSNTSIQKLALQLCPSQSWKTQPLVNQSLFIPSTLLVNKDWTSNLSNQALRFRWKTKLSEELSTLEVLPSWWSELYPMRFHKNTFKK